MQKSRRNYMGAKPSNNRTTSSFSSICNIRSNIMPALPATGPSSSSVGKKRAVLCGVSYKKNWKHKLMGTINDVNNMKDLLINFYGYPQGSVLILTEEEDQNRIPTKKNIQNALKWLVEGCQSGDKLVFYFSGHGLRQPDFDEDEIDGYDETICPVDFLDKGMILDNEINSTIVWPLKKGVTLHAIIDACHSGTMLDLKYVYNHHKSNWSDNSPPSGARKSTNGGLAISLSACGDDQFASDTSVLSRNTVNGAMTFILIDIIKTNQGLTYRRLLDLMNEAVGRANQQGCFKSTLFKKLFRPKMIQEPLLSSSEVFDVYKKKFEL